VGPPFSSYLTPCALCSLTSAAGPVNNVTFPPPLPSEFVSPTHLNFNNPIHSPTRTNPTGRIAIAIMGGRPVNLYSFADVDKDLAPNLRRYVLEAQNEAIKRHNTFRVAVSGGSLPKVLAKALLTPTDSKSPSDRADFSKWEIFYADERCVPLTHEDSNHKLVQEELLSKIPAELGTPKVFPIDESLLDNPQEAADAYEKTLVSIFAARDSVKLPLFDLLLLGCGPDGHTCSLFPSYPQLRETDAWVLSIEDSPKPPPKRITLSLPVVQHAARIAFVGTGAGKKDVLKSIFESEEGRQLPCGLVNEGAGERVSWFCDAAATEGVNFPKRSSVI
jgi:6-phosphogluconolactonase